MTRAGTVWAITAALAVAACSDPIAPVMESTDAEAVTAARGSPTRGYRYEGCGTEFGTCATVVMNAQEIEPGVFRLRGYVENRSYNARGDFRNALLVFASTGGGFADIHDGYREYDCLDCNAAMGGPSVVWASFTGPYDQRCERNRRCNALKLTSFVDPGPSSAPWAEPQVVEFHYQPGRIFFDRITYLPDWTPQSPLEVTQFFVGGSATTENATGEIETYALKLRGTGALRIPTNLVASRAVNRTPAQAAAHIARAKASARGVFAQLDGLSR